MWDASSVISRSSSSSGLFRSTGEESSCEHMFAIYDPHRTETRSGSERGRRRLDSRRLPRAGGVLGDRADDLGPGDPWEVVAHALDLHEPGAGDRLGGRAA